MKIPIGILGHRFLQTLEWFVLKMQLASTTAHLELLPTASVGTFLLCNLLRRRWLALALKPASLIISSLCSC